ncbi:hypothetical protein N8072_01520 [bacterium]|nr:hypothetical protein [bacterium]MDC1257333.1 hypothetical protein [bacterium]
MAKAPKKFYLTNKDLLKEIHNSKMSYCWIREEGDSEKYFYFDMIIESLDEITPENIEQARQNRATRMQKVAHDAEVTRWENGLVARRTKPRAADFLVDPATIDDKQLVFRLMTFDHVPDEPGRKNNPKTVADTKTKVNFPPFKHIALVEGKWDECARSHWAGGKDNGHFSIDHGVTNQKLAVMYMKLCERYSRRGNWRGYTYVDEMRSQALLQLSQIGLQFNEFKSQNPFAYYTAAINNSFTRVLNLEKRNQNIRDDILEQNGLDPSWTRTFGAEWESIQENRVEDKK